MGSGAGEAQDGRNSSSTQQELEQTTKPCQDEREFRRVFCGEIGWGVSIRRTQRMLPSFATRTPRGGEKGDGIDVRTRFSARVCGLRYFRSVLPLTTCLPSNVRCFFTRRASRVPAIVAWIFFSLPLTASSPLSFTVPSRKIRTAAIPWRRSQRIPYAPPRSRPGGGPCRCVGACFFAFMLLLLKSPLTRCHRVRDKQKSNV